MNAIEKLSNEKSNVKTDEDKMIIDALIKRCKESTALAQDVMNPKKSLKNCFEYIVNEARKLANGKQRFYLADDKVFELAEDYYHAKDLDIDKPKPEPQKFDVKKAIEKAQETAQAKIAKNAPKKKATVMQMPKKPSAPPKPTEKKAVAKQKKPEEQFSLFDFM